MTVNTFTLKSKIAFQLYRLLVMPCVAVVLPLIGMFHRKVRDGIRLRRRLPEAIPGPEAPFWIHAASGEFEYAKAVIRELKMERPNIPIVVTYFSPSFAKAVHDFAGVDQAVALPLDLPGPCRGFLKTVRPRMLLVARTDLWPEMLAQTRAANIPIYLFSYTQKKVDGYFAKLFTKERLRLVDRIYCVGRADNAELDELDVRVPHERLGDTRYDQVAYRLKHGRKLDLKKPWGMPTFVAGSTWEEDEAVLLPGLQTKLQNRRLQLILVPHEPGEAHLRQLEEKIFALNLKSRRFSKIEGEWFAEEILLVDRIGILAELYLLADFAFVGGSFKKTVHSVMEALGAGVMTFVGPKHQNNREAMEFKELIFARYPGVSVFNSAAELDQMLSARMANAEQLLDFRYSLESEFKHRLGASRRFVSIISARPDPHAELT